nr:unnamed protein product [Callosobruchus analis]
MEKLIRQRGGVKATLTNFEKYLTNIQTSEKLSDVEIIELQGRINIIEGNIYQKFSDVQDQIEAVCDENDLDREYNERENDEGYKVAFDKADAEIIVNLCQELQAVLGGNIIWVKNWVHQYQRTMHLHEYLQYLASNTNGSTMNLTHENYSIIPISPYTEEFNHCINRFTGDYYTHIEGLYRVYNPSSNLKFNLRLEQYKTKDSYCIRSLFHDTLEENTESICMNNFDWRYGRRYKYGPGVYFSISPTLANRHSSRGPCLRRSMFIVNVLMSKVLNVPEGAEVSLPDLYYDEDYDTILCHGEQTYLKFFDCEYYPIYFINYISKW